MTMYDLHQFDDSINKTIEWLVKEFIHLDSNNISAGVLDKIIVNVYSNNVPVSQLASISAENKKTLLISVWDQANVTFIASAIEDANLGASVSTASNSVRVSFPDTTESTRQDFVNLAKAKVEEAKVSIRKKRELLLNEIKKADLSEISEDEKFISKNKIQIKIDESVKTLHEMLKKKIDNIMEVS